MPSSALSTSMPAAPRRILARIRHALPKGQTLPDSVWQRRHRALIALLLFHAVALPVYALIQGNGLHSVEHGVAPAVLAALGYVLRHRRRVAATLVSVGLITTSALVVHISGGVIEAHFHFFVMVIVLALYEDWIPFLVAAAYVVLHHGLLSAIDPHSVYNHPDALAHPWKWAIIHGAFVSAAGFVSVIAWRLNEGARTEAAAASRRTRQILETAHDAFISIDEHGIITDCNPQAERTFGWTCEEMLGRELAELLLPERYRETQRRGLERFLATGEGPVLGNRLELMALNSAGEEFPVELTVSALETDTGHSFNAFLRDITERKAAEELVERQRRSLAEAQSVGGLGSWQWDVASDTVEWSDELCRIYGLEPGSHPSTFDEALERTHADDRALLRDTVEGALEAGEAFAFEMRIQRPDGAIRILHCRGEVVIGADGTPLRMLGTGQDITERRELERTKDEFTSIVSHELRTPLTSIRGSLGLLESGALGTLPEKGQRMVEIAVDNTDRLVRLINDILDIERIDSGKIHMRKQETDAEELVGRSVEGLAQFALDAEVKLVADARPVPVHADPDRVIQALTNLISNAVKFSPAGSAVRVSAVRQEDEVIFEVADEGRGIPEEHLDSIFERFQQVDASDSREKGGTGLGLAICRTIVENHGGRIWVESVPGEGSTFAFSLPALADHEGADEHQGSPGRRTVLVCDDDRSVVEVIGTMLAERGYRVIEATSGSQALERAVAERPDAILLDLLMPGLSGSETMAALASRPETKEIPVLILSVLSEAEGDPPSAPILGWLQKPIDEAALFDALERAVGGHPEPFKVLVVEDDPGVAELLSSILQARGFETFNAASGSGAIELTQRVLPDLLVLDIGLPEADGFEVVDWLRRHERLSTLPIVVYTGRELTEAERERLRLAEITEFFNKGSVSPEEFERRVIELIARLVNERVRGREDEYEAHPVG